MSFSATAPLTDHCLLAATPSRDQDNCAPLAGAGLQFDVSKKFKSLKLSPITQCVLNPMSQAFDAAAFGFSSVGFAAPAAFAVCVPDTYFLGELSGLLPMVNSASRSP